MTGNSVYPPPNMQFDTERLVLREFEESDAEACNEYERQPDVVRYQSFGPRTVAESLAYIKESVASAREVPRLIYDFAVVLRGADHPIGRCGFKVQSRDDREGALWYILHPAYWGRGIIPEASRAVLAFGFGELRLHRVIVDCDPANTASIRVAEKLGMRLEAHFVENAWVKGAWADSLILAILEREWLGQQRA
jgi:ribosomal-protein-alanine N-acetyltransferase